MKKVLNSSIAVILITAMVNTASAQGSDKNGLALLESSNSSKTSPTVKSISRADVNSKAVKSFEKSFKNAADALWFPNGSGYTVRFNNDGIRSSAEYDKKGRWISTVSYYRENRMSRELRKQIKSTYFDYKINQVIEIHTLLGSAVIVQLEDEISFLNIRVVDGVMDVYEEIQKQK
jgi:hypothetical protein